MLEIHDFPDTQQVGRLHSTQTESKVKHVMMHWPKSMPKLHRKQGKKVLIQLARHEPRINS